MIVCGNCGHRQAVWEVFEARQAHCTQCLLEAIDSSVWATVRRLDELATINTQES